MKKIVIVLMAMLWTVVGLSQSQAGQEGFAVLNLFNSAQMTQRGFNFIPRFVKETSSSIANPATLDSTVSGIASLTYTDIFAGAYQGALHYAHSFNKIGTFGFGIQYINYGTFQRTSANGDNEGSFSCNDFMLNIAWGRQIEKNVYLGVSFKPLFSTYESYSSASLAFDVSAMWTSNSKLWQAGLVLKNIGRQVKSFASQRDTLPFDMQIGLSKQFSHAPLILYVVADNLTKWNIREDDPLNPHYQVEIDGTINKENSFTAFLDKGFRHLKFAIDIRANKFVDLSLGYSWRQHQEMAVGDAFSLAGFSYGLNLHYKQFSLAYARNEYHNYGSPNYITLSYNFGWQQK